MNETQLISTIKAHIVKGDQAKDKADQHYVSAGQHLKTLKAQHEGTWVEWEALLKDKVGIGKSRASELMQIADGTKTVEGTRAATNDRTRETRERAAISPLRSGETEDANRESLPSEIFITEEGSRRKIPIAQLRAPDGDAWSPEAGEHPLPPEGRRRGLLSRASEAIRLARFDDLVGLAIDEEMRKAAEEAVNAWTVTLTRMEEAIHGKDEAA
jgi:hypothetical protein